MSASPGGPQPVGRRRVTAALLAALLLLIAQQPASTVGDHEGIPFGPFGSCRRPVTPPRCTSMGNNLRHFVSFDDTLTDGLASSLRDTMAEDYDPTDLTMVEQDSVTQATDVIAYSEDYGDIGAAAWVYCPTDAPQGKNPTGDRWCQRQELRLNLNPRFAVFFADDGSRDHVTCHELGHTVGLRHWGNPPNSGGPAAPTCMNADNPNGPPDLHQIDVSHINDYTYTAPWPHSWHVVSKAEPGRTVATASNWAAVGADAVEAEHFASLGEITRSADAVVRGRVVAIDRGRAFGAPDSALHYAAATVRVDEVLAGSLPMRHAAELTLEIPLFDGPESLGAMQAGLPWAESLFFLRNKGASARAAGLPLASRRADEGFYRLVTFRSVIVNDGGGAEVVPGDGDFLDALAGRRFDQIVARVRRSS